MTWPRNKLMAFNVVLVATIKFVSLINLTVWISESNVNSLTVFVFSNDSNFLKVSKSKICNLSSKPWNIRDPSWDQAKETELLKWLKFGKEIFFKHQLLSWESKDQNFSPPLLSAVKQPWLLLTDLGEGNILVIGTLIPCGFITFVFKFQFVSLSFLVQNFKIWVKSLEDKRSFGGYSISYVIIHCPSLVNFKSVIIGSCKFSSNLTLPIELLTPDVKYW